MSVDRLDRATAIGSESPWPDIRAELRSRGLRWTPQRKLILDVLGEAQGHVTGSEIVERCRAREPETTPSTVYRTLAVLEELGYLHHSHAADGREEFHVLPASRHAHLHCSSCGQTWEIDERRGEAVADVLRAGDGFEIDIGHVTLVGLCRQCADAARA
jgi:Fur family transcriptional regulator, ferric uptake regulator